MTEAGVTQKIRDASGHTADTKLCAVLLHPASHTRSPAMHNAAFAAHGLDARYFAFDVPRAEFAGALRAARERGYAQLAISLPHKEDARRQFETRAFGELTENARKIGAVNTLTRDGERWRGANTDWLGLVRALERETQLADQRAVVLGAGGTARAAVFGLRERGARVQVLSRSEEKGRALARSLDAEHCGGLQKLGKLEYNILVNATSVGLGGGESPVPKDALRENTVVFDAVYEPEETTLLKDAKAQGARAVSGKWMLVHQAAEQIRLWSGVEPDITIMARAFDAARPT